MSSSEKMSEIQKDKYECSKVVLRKRNLLFEHLWLTASKIKEQFKDLTPRKQSQVICLIRLIISLLRESKKSEEVVRNLTHANGRKNKKTRKHTNTCKKPQTLATKVQIQSTVNGRLHTQGICDSLSETSAGSQERIATAVNVVDSEVKSEHIDLKTELDEMEIMDVADRPTNEVEIISGSPLPPNLITTPVVDPVDSVVNFEFVDITKQDEGIKITNSSNRPTFEAVINCKHPSAPIWVNIMPSDRGNLYIIDGYIFYANQCNKGVMYLRCSTIKCPSRANFSSHRQPTYTKHNHTPNELDVEVVYMKAELKQKVMLDSKTPWEIYNEVREKYPRAATKVTFKGIKSSLYRWARIKRRQLNL